MARKATAQDVADLAGVSRSAVSLVLNGRAKGHIASHKQQAIIEAARRLNYTPNAVALSLRSRRSRTIGVLTWPGQSGVSVPMLHATLEKATAEGYLLIFMDTETPLWPGQVRTPIVRLRRLRRLRATAFGV